MARLWRNNSLTIVLMLIFLAFLLGQLLVGWRAEVAEYAEHGKPALSLGQYALSGEFLSSVFENWESEFLQMSAYVILTAVLVQKGSAEARAPDEPPREGDEQRSPNGRLEAIGKAIYARSLGLALAALFLLSFGLHFRYSAAAAAERAALHGAATPGLLAYAADPEFWFESFQNWQSEFLSTAVLVVLAIFLRQKGSPESKPVEAANAENK